ncbi:MAG: DegQ family serine endoprotease [Hahellaceae bacterium]|nr:DegQ family serine endoprotease [Hahellaceae bacterium]MCP5170535.1 DegQ family serine endoprotease [Hahellaceae bacterium]
MNFIIAFFIHVIVFFTFFVGGTLQAQADIPVALGDGTRLPSLAPILEKSTPAVVNIATFTTVKTYNPLWQDPFFRRFFSVPDNYSQEKQTQSAGSGVIVDASHGYVLTNHHVVEGADEITVTLTDGRVFSAQRVGSDKQADLAVLKIEADHLSELPMGESGELRVGDFVIAIGNPFGLGQTVTSGIVSALGRSGLGIQGYEDFIQTDASINPGNSGGALINLRGELVGINSAIIAPSGGNVGIGFAIPTEIVRTVMRQLLEFGEVRRGRLGVHFQDMTSELAEAFGLANVQGAVIARVLADSPAERAGFKVGDIVSRVNGREIRNASDLRNRIGLTPVGEKMTVELLRKGRTLTLTALIEETPVPELAGSAMNALLQGILFRDFIDPQGTESVAVQVADIDSASTAYEAGLRKGDVIVVTNRMRTRSTEHLKQAVKGMQRLVMRIEREGRSYQLTLR